MAQVQRRDAAPAAAPPAPTPVAHALGGEVGRLQSDLAQRLRDRELQPLPVGGDSAAERTIRFVSVAGGVVALAAAYAAIAFVMLG